MCLVMHLSDLAYTTLQKTSVKDLDLEAAYAERQVCYNVDFHDL